MPFGLKSGSLFASWRIGSDQVGGYTSARKPRTLRSGTTSDGKSRLTACPPSGGNPSLGRPLRGVISVRRRVAYLVHVVTCGGRVDASLVVAMGNDRDRDAAGRARQARPRDALGRPLPYGTPGVEPVSEEPLPPDETLQAACALLRGGRPFAAHEVFEARWKAGPSSERELWQGLAQICVGLTHAARGNSVGAQRLIERGCDHLLRHVATGSTSYGLDLPSAIDWARRSVDVPPDRVG